MGILLSLLIPALPSLIQVVEHLFGAGTGAAKMEAILAMVKHLIPNLQLPAGTTAGTITDDQIKGAVEVILANLKDQNKLAMPLPNPIPAVNELWIGRGSFVKITV